MFEGEQRSHTPETIFLFLGKPFGKTLDTEDFKSTPLRMGFKLISFMASPDVYRMALPLAAKTYNAKK